MSGRRKTVDEEEPEDLDQAREDMLQFQRDGHYLATIYDELKTEHPDEWVGIYRGEVVAIGPDLDRVIDVLEQRGISPAHATLEHIIPPGRIIAY